MGVLNLQNCLFFALKTRLFFGQKVTLGEVALAQVDVAQKLLQLGHLDPHEVEQGVGVEILCKEPFEERTRGCWDHSSPYGEGGVTGL